MKIRLLLLPIIAVLAIALGVRAQEAKKDDQTELGAKMEKASSAWRKAKSAVNAGLSDAAKKQEALDQIAIVRENLTASTKLEPKKKAPEGTDQKKWISDYQAKLKEELGNLDKLEAAIKAGKDEEAKTLVGTVDTTQKEGHTQFKQGKKKQN